MTKVFSIENVNFDVSQQKGTCQLVSKKYNYVLCWSIENYPVERAGMPGSPYPVIFNYTIFKKGQNGLKSLSGKFIYEINSGTLPEYNSLGVLNGKYNSIARNDKHEGSVYIQFSLSNTEMELHISN